MIITFVKQIRRSVKEEALDYTTDVRGLYIFDSGLFIGRTHRV